MLRSVFVSPVIALVIFLSTFSAHAGYLRMVPHTKISVDPIKKVLVFDIEILNDGDESSRSIEIEFPSLNRKFQVIAALDAKQKTKFSQEFPLPQAWLDTPGYYWMPYRILYRDLNLYQSSNPLAEAVITGNAPSTALIGEIEGVDATQTVALSDVTDFSMKLVNTSNSTLTVNKAYLLMPTEIQDLSKEHPRFEIPSNGSQSLKFRVKRLRALPGSAYMVAVLIEGISGGRAFAESVQFRLNITNPVSSYRDMIQWALIAIAGIGVLWVIFRKWIKKGK